MSDLKEAASEAMGIPLALVERSAAARAAENDTDVDQILTAWAGGEAAPAAAPEPEPQEPEPAEEPAGPEEEAPEDQATEPAAPTVVIPETPAPEPRPEEPVLEPEEPLEPVPLGTRLGTAMRVGAWSGAGLGLVAFLMATASWAPRTAVLPDIGPVVQTEPGSILIGTAVVSVVFGALVASLARAGAAWRNPAMQLSSSKSSTAWIGAVTGLVLGLIGGATLSSGLATPVTGSEEGLVQLPVLPTLAALLAGGALLGAVTAAIPQLLGTPVALGEDDEEEVEEVKSRLGKAMSIPMAAALLLVLLVIPFGYMLIQSNHLGDNGAAIVAILTAGGILGFASLAGGKPEMRITFGEIMVAVAGIGTVLLIILAVLFYTGQDDEHDPGGEEAAISVIV